MIVSKLNLAYYEDNILEDINFELQGHLSILGSNGSGKSTLAKALCGLLPYQGSIKINNQEFSSIASKERAKLIAYIPSKMHSFELFTTVEDFVLLGRYPYKQSYKDYTLNDKNIVTKILEELNIQELKNHKLQELSSGQQQLTLIAQALAQQSKVLIFDEPTSNLDPKNTLLFAKELLKLRKNHQTILITHDIQLAAHLNDPVLFIQDKKAELFKEGFFQTDKLNHAYGITFKSTDGMIGISYA